VTESSAAYELSNVVETALARALVLAAEAKQWEMVTQIADELLARRHARGMLNRLASSQDDEKVGIDLVGKGIRKSRQ
jgi:hypothetical protein